MATLDDVAKRARVSRMTAARALSNQTKAIWPGTAARVERIRRIAAEIGYLPSAAAKATRTGRFHAAAFVNRADMNFMPYELTQGVCDTLAGIDMHMMLVRLAAEDVADERRVPKILRELCVDGLIIHEAQNVPDAVMTMVRRHRIPTVWVNTDGPVDCVYPDEQEAAFRATRSLLALGHRRISFVDFDIIWDPHAEPHYSSAARRRGYASAMTSAGVATDVVEGAYPPGPGRTAPWGLAGDDRGARLTALLRRPDRPTALVVGTLPSLAVVVQVAMRFGMAVPRDLSLVVFHEQVVEMFDFRVSTLLQPFRAAGEESVRMLERKIRERAEMPLASILVPFEAVTGQTMAQPPQNS